MQSSQRLIRKTRPFDYSVKLREENSNPTCLADTTVSVLAERQAQTVDDFSCSESKPCSNGACCSKKSGFCNYGPEACGTNGQSPNELCWSNCDAHAECGKFALVPGTKCPLNVCCSPFGFCGMTEDFCKKGTDEDPGCQSNCDQPPSGASGGNVQNRIIGYYEAWAHDRKCQGMDFDTIPVGAFTHLYFSFGYITPGGFEVVPMDELDETLFTQFTDVKKRNSGLKTIVALGGWTFNDNGTATQPVFSNMVSSQTNRATFIKNLFSFLRQHAYDGVDFDWEYPGATDRGGQPDDGKNFVQFLKELDDANNKQPVKYVVSFTVPTSFWYLRHFDLKAVDHVDFINVMSYDLHGICDSTNLIGSHIYAHTNLSEISLAMDLFWRNDVPPAKLNLGLGFYGRSFQLSDPSCYKPGCNFKGGASPGGCSNNAGTLTYKEIQQVIKSNNIKPYHDKEAGVKYITWKGDQWVSFDDEETFKAKIDFANKLGLGGLLIWAVDQDTDDLEALRGVLAPKSVKAFAAMADEKAFWEEAAVPDCYVTDCGGSCKTGFFKIENQPCGGAKPVTRHSKEKDSQLCCPLSGAPNPKDCTWRGEAPSCNGHCHDDEVTMELNRWGSGKYCEDGNKAYCCQSPEAKENKCYWAGVGRKCNSDDTTMTFSGTFVSTISDIVSLGGLIGSPLALFLDEADMDLQKRYCCPKKDASKWSNCRWYGQPGSCFDNHCPVSGHSIQLTDSPYGLGQSCFPRMERSRVHCCDPTGGKSPFLPVPLENLFPSPPTGDDIDTDFDLNVDDTFGDGAGHEHTSEEPGDASFQFVVLSSPEELQVSLDKRDGSHWEVFNCRDGMEEGEHTVQMVCTDTSETSNCYKIGLGHGAPGTILQMPPGCGPGRYAVAKSMKPSKIPASAHLRKRLSMPATYDLTFDYDFTRVPRDLGDTQMRIDFSNKDNYWDNVVAAAADFGGSHKRWLEEEWRDDYHFGGSTVEELHKRWFGSGVIDWLKGLVNPKVTKQFTHDIDETVIAKIIDEEWDCPLGDNGKFDGHVLIQAETTVKVATSFGFTLITKLSLPLDLSQSYLTFGNAGEVTATFTLDAVAGVSYNKEMEILTLPFPGATFRVPGIVTIGPSVRVLGQIAASLTVSAEIEAKVDIASWEIEQTLPAASSEFEPDEDDLVSPRNTGNMDGLSNPSFYAGVKAEGSVEAHIKASMEFGIRFDDKWKVGAAAAGVVADGYVRFKVGAGKSNEATCPWSYGLDLGVSLYAQVESPPLLGWGTKTWPLPGSGEVPLIKGGTCPDLKQGQSARRSLPATENGYGWDQSNPGTMLIAQGEGQNSTSSSIGKRVAVYGPAVTLDLQSRFCPNSDDDAGSKTLCSAIRAGWEDEGDDPLGDLVTRSLDISHAINLLEKRSKKTPKAFCAKKAGEAGAAKMNYQTPEYDENSAITYGYTKVDECNDFGFGVITTPATTDRSRYRTEHVLEAQLLGIFFDDIVSPGSKEVFDCNDPTPDAKAPPGKKLCYCMQPLWYQLPSALYPSVNIGGNVFQGRPIDIVGQAWPGKGNDWKSEFVLLDEGVNGVKERMWGDGEIRNDRGMSSNLDGTTDKSNPERLIKAVKDAITAFKYHSDAEINRILVVQVDRVGTWLNTMDSVTWKSQDLQGRWKKWMKGRYAKAMTKAEDFIPAAITKLETKFASVDQKKDAVGDAKTRIDKIVALKKEWTDNKATWTNPF
ncbi:hypothetical protein HYALB_00003326 [Hymenoscyphus albidus]|uniref:chitinase n=1 Tax=Hymenoscyphus albidus TaxID=595503 RepID=A0A9N9LDY8_9HELO|nr:hypothetical protein HYALB_00003326 [Hymenoscyphus albidus]